MRRDGGCGSRSRIGQFEWLPKECKITGLQPRKGSCGRASPFVACSPAHASSHPHLPTQKACQPYTEPGGRRAESPELHVSPGLPGLPGVLETFLCYRGHWCLHEKTMQEINKQRKRKSSFPPACQRLLAPFEARPNKIILTWQNQVYALTCLYSCGCVNSMSPVLTKHVSQQTWNMVFHTSGHQ